MYYILKMILECDDGLSGQQIVMKLKEYDIDLDVKTVYSCIQHINAFFFEWIHSDIIISKKRHGFMIHKDIFTDGECQFLLDSITFHHDLLDEDKNTLKQKLLFWASCPQQKRLISFPSKGKELHFSLFINLTTIMKAIENKKMITFQYINYDIYKETLHEIPSQHGNIDDQYILSPYQIILQNNHYYIVGYNEKYKEQLSIYRIDRMRHVTMIKKALKEVREQYDMVCEIEKMTNMYPSQEKDTLKIECDKKTLREVVSRFGMNVYAKKVYDNSYYIEIEDVSISQGLIGWIMMLQDQIRVIGPLSLKRELKQKILKMSEIYKDVE